MSVLIAIATSHNATLEIGNRIAARLRTAIPAASVVDVLPVADVPADSVPKYSAVVVGSCIHAGRWISPARAFIHKQSATLGEKPVWAFSVGVPPDRENKDAEEANVGKAIRREIPALKGHALFMGKIEKEQLPWVVGVFFTWFPQYAKFGDFREWEAIDKWADEVGNELKAGADKS